MDYRKVAEKNLVLKVNIGSNLYGTNTEDSDVDMAGIFMPDESLVYGFSRCNEVDAGVVSKDDDGKNTSKAIDYKIREYRDFVRLAMECNPNIIEVLFVNEDNILHINGFGKRLIDAAYMFPSKNGLRRFIGFGMSQMKKMTIKPDNCKALNQAYAYLSSMDRNDIISNVCSKNIMSIVDLGVGKHIKIGDIYVERGLSVKSVLKKIDARLESISYRGEMWDKYGYDLKFASQFIRILKEGIEIANTGRINFPLSYADLILDIKNGSMDLDWVVREGEMLMDTLCIARDNSDVLPERPRIDKIESFVIGEVSEWFRSKFN